MDTTNITASLAEYLVRSGLVLGFGLLMARLISKHSAATKHHVLMFFVIVSLLYVPIVWWAPKIEILPENLSFMPVTESIAIEAQPRPLLGNDSAGAAETFAMKSATPLQIGTLFTIVYFLGFILLVSYQCIGLTQLHFIARRSKATQSHSGVSYYISDRINSPMTIGVFRPIILVPKKKYSQSELSIILSHEQQHINRRDCLAIQLSRLLLAINWVNPFAWIILKKLEVFREEACDRKVIDHGYNNVEYAEILYRHLQLGSNSSASTYAGVNDGNLEQRINKILTMKVNEKNSTNRTKASLIVPALLAAAIGLGFFDLKAADRETADFEAIAEQKANQRAELMKAFRHNPEKTTSPDVIIAKAEKFLSDYPSLTLGEKVDIHWVIAVAKNRLTRSKSEMAENYDQVISDLKLTGENQQRILNEKLRNCYRLNPNKAQAVYNEIVEIDSESNYAKSAKSNLDSIIKRNAK